MAKVTNISTGPRGAYLDGQLVMAEKGETIEADDYSRDWFKSAGKAKDDDKSDQPKALDKMNKAELLAVAADENVAVETDDKKAELVRKIEEARAAQ
ncbi:MAG: hypothetical protein ACR652_17710 [Methylocystis sp.]|uniref:hypothetical protein n=1 Tax=Methylocystis sp. TaxID=1911079 RepID=UPI003DA3A9EF